MSQQEGHFCYNKTQRKALMLKQRVKKIQLDVSRLYHFSLKTTRSLMYKLRHNRTTRLLLKFLHPLLHNPITNFLRAGLNRVQRLVSRVVSKLSRRFYHLSFFARTSIALGLVMTIVLISLFTITYVQKRQSYVITPAEAKLLPTPSIDTSKITETKDSISYNHEQSDKELNLEQAGLKDAVTIAPPAQDTNSKIPYQASISKDPSKGITFGDGQGDLGFKILPQYW